MPPPPLEPAEPGDPGGGGERDPERRAGECKGLVALPLVPPRPLAPPKAVPELLGRRAGDSAGEGGPVCRLPNPLPPAAVAAANAAAAARHPSTGSQAAPARVVRSADAPIAAGASTCVGWTAEWIWIHSRHRRAEPAAPFAEAVHSAQARPVSGSPPWLSHVRGRGWRPRRERNSVAGGMLSAREKAWPRNRG